MSSAAILSRGARGVMSAGNLSKAGALSAHGLQYIQGAAEKSGPLNFFAVFSATVWDFNTKFYSFIYRNLLHLTAK